MLENNHNGKGSDDAYNITNKAKQEVRCTNFIHIFLGISIYVILKTQSNKYSRNDYIA